MSQSVEVAVSQISATASRGTVRNHDITMDRPEAKGGENRGAMGGEVLLMGLGGCFMSNLLAAVTAREATVSNIRLAIDGTLDSAPPHFSAIRLTISADYADRAEMEKLVAIAEKGCIVANTLRKGLELTIEIA